MLSDKYNSDLSQQEKLPLVYTTIVQNLTGLAVSLDSTK